jgi:hypothetical protein
MGVARMLRSWRRVVQEALPHLHGHQLNGLADASWAMIQASHCQLSKMAVASPGEAAVPSRERRWQRLVANERLDAQRAMEPWARWALRDASAVTLLLDETPQYNHLRAMKLSRMTGGRAIPLLWHTYRPEAPPMDQRELVLDLLHRVDAALPEEAQPTLMTDRGLSWPAVVEFCAEHGWRFVLRVQGNTKVRLEGGDERPMPELAPRPGAGWCGPGDVFKHAGWRRVNLIAHWAPGQEEPWLLITDLPASFRRCRQYRKRMRQEQSFRDEKSHGFRWNDSRIRDPAHAERLLLIMALAMTWLIRTGLAIIRRGRRRYYERPDRRSLSLFQLGLRCLHDQLKPTRDPPAFKTVGR